MKSFSVFLHVQPTEIRFVGDSLEDAGFHQTNNGQWVDARGNTVAKVTETEIDERDAEQLRQAYCGDDRCDRAGFVS
jgi:hypothetical protein